MNKPFDLLKNLVVAIDNYYDRDDVKAIIDQDNRPSDDHYLQAFQAAKEHVEQTSNCND